MFGANVYDSSSIHTIEPTGCAQDGLDNAHDTLEPFLDVGILCLYRLFFSEHHLEVMVRLLALQVSYPLIEPVDLVLGALSYRALGLAVVCAFPSQLLGSEVGDTARVGARPALLIRMVIFRLFAVSDGRRWCSRIARGRHADYGQMLDATQLRERELIARVMKLAQHGDGDWRAALAHRPTPHFLQCLG